MQSVLVLSYREDPHADFVCGRLKELGSDYFRLDTEEINRDYFITFDSNSGLFRISNKDRALVVDSNWNIWNRRVVRPNVPDSLSEEQQKIVVVESIKTLDQLLETHKGKVVDKPVNVFSANFKIEQLMYVKEHGKKYSVVIPETLLTNDPEELRRFFREKRKICHKLQIVPGVQTGDGRFSPYTGIVGPKEIENADLIRMHPSTFQEYVEKWRELRITALKNKIIGVEIDSKNRVDFRKGKIEDLEHRIVDLPERIKQFCSDLLNHYGLNFAQIDMIQLREERDCNYVFLELNAMGQWLWLELLTEYPLSRDLAEMLVSE